jgi:hypothetical protein
VRLADFFATLGPYLLGLKGHDDTVARLYGDAPPPRDAARLAIYADFCRAHRRDALDSVFSHCLEAANRRCGAALWPTVVERYFVAHPMRHFEMSRNGEHFPDFIAGLVAAGELPPFLAELADFEWWEYLTAIRPDEPDDGEGGPLRLHSSVDLRPYKHDLITWIDGDDREPEAPAVRDIVVLFYRDRQLAPRRESANGLTLLIAKAIFEAVPLDEKLAALLQLEPAALRAAVAALRERGVILGG